MPKQDLRQQSRLVEAPSSPALHTASCGAGSDEKTKASSPAQVSGAFLAVPQGRSKPGAVPKPGAAGDEPAPGARDSRRPSRAAPAPAGLWAAAHRPRSPPRPPAAAASSGTFPTAANAKPATAGRDEGRGPSAAAPGALGLSQRRPRLSRPLPPASPPPTSAGCRARPETPAVPPVRGEQRSPAGPGPGPLRRWRVLREGAGPAAASRHLRAGGWRSGAVAGREQRARLPPPQPVGAARSALNAAPLSPLPPAPAAAPAANPTGAPVPRRARAGGQARCSRCPGPRFGRLRRARGVPRPLPSAAAAAGGALRNVAVVAGPC
ncbi:basic proline-rich protein-like [Lathamus discolor]|uniref:basic proline-rich protein-like n=1 Tax=Lathamus discolor TaxID=678569 RepID=UPI0032B715A1